MLQQLSWCAPRVLANSPTFYYTRRSFFFFFSLAIKCVPTFIKLRVATGKCGLSSKSLKILARSCGVLRTIPRYIIRMSRVHTRTHARTHAHTRAHTHTHIYTRYINIMWKKNEQQHFPFIFFPLIFLVLLFLFFLHFFIFSRSDFFLHQNILAL